MVRALSASGALVVGCLLFGGACRMAPPTLVTVTQSARVASPLPVSPVPTVSPLPTPQESSSSPSPSPLLPETSPFYQPVEALTSTPIPLVSAALSASLQPLSSPTPIALPSAVVSVMPSPVPTQAPEQALVRIRNFNFEPGVVTIRQGGSVVFINDDAVSHSVVPEGDVFVPTGVIQPGSFKTISLAQVGSFGYRCAIYTGMAGQIQVVP